MSATPALLLLHSIVPYLTRDRLVSSLPSLCSLLSRSRALACVEDELLLSVDGGETSAGGGGAAAAGATARRASAKQLTESVCMAVGELFCERGVSVSGGDTSGEEDEWNVASAASALLSVFARQLGHDAVLHFHGKWLRTALERVGKLLAVHKQKHTRSGKEEADEDSDEDMIDSTSSAPTVLLSEPEMRHALLCCELVLDVVERALFWPDTRRAVLVESLPRYVPLLVQLVRASTSTATTVRVLKLISRSVGSLKASMRPFISAVQDVCIPLLPSDDADVRNLAITVLARTSHVHDGAVWSSFFERTLLTLWDTLRRPLSALGFNMPSVQANDQDEAPELLSAKWSAVLSTDDSIHRAEALQVRVAALCSLLVEMLSLPEGHAPTGVQIRVPAILALCNSVLSCEVHDRALTKFTGAKLTPLSLRAVLPLLQTSILRVVSRVVAVGKRRILPHVSTLSSSLLDLLRRMRSSRSENALALQQLYRTSVDLFEAFGAAFPGGWCESFVSIALQDCTLPFEFRHRLLESAADDAFRLGGDVGNGKKRKGQSRRMRKQQRMLELIDSDLPLSTGSSSSSSASATTSLLSRGAVTSPDEIPVDEGLEHLIDATAVTALEALAALVANTAATLQPATRVAIDRAVISLLLATSTETGTLLAGVPTDLRMQLYQLLLSSFLVPHPASSALVPYARRFFTHGSRDPHRSISNLCKQGVLSLRMLSMHATPTMASSFQNAEQWNPLQFSPAARIVHVQSSQPAAPAQADAAAPTSFAASSPPQSAFGVLPSTHTFGSTSTDPGFGSSTATIGKKRPVTEVTPAPVEEQPEAATPSPAKRPHIEPASVAAQAAQAAASSSSSSSLPAPPQQPAAPPAPPAPPAAPAALDPDNLPQLIDEDPDEDEQGALWTM